MPVYSVHRLIQGTTNRALCGMRPERLKDPRNWNATDRDHFEDAIGVCKSCDLLHKRRASYQ